MVDQKQKKLNKPILVLVVCPKNIIGSWEDELKIHVTNYIFYDTLNSFLKGPSQDTCPYTFVVTNYEQIRTKLVQFLSVDWDFMILDESHRIKNMRAKITKSILRFISTPYKLILSGTPITKDELDLWPQYQFLNPKIWGNNFYSFLEHSCRKIRMGDIQIFKPVKKKMKPFLEKASKFTYIVKLDEIAEMPGMNNIPIQLNMRGDQRKTYGELKEGFLTEYQGHRSTHSLNVTGLLRLQQLAGGHLTLETNDVIRMKEQPKLLWILDKLHDLGKEKIIIFCRYTLEIELIAQALKKYKYNYVIMKGGMSTPETNEARRKFKEDEKCQVLIGQIQSVKEGNNFQKLCRYGIFYSKTFSHVDIDQCKKRLYRNGQARKVIFWHLIMKNSIDEGIEKVVEKKYLNAEEVLLKLIMKKD